MTTDIIITTMFIFVAWQEYRLLRPIRGIRLISGNILKLFAHFEALAREVEALDRKVKTIERNRQ